MKNRCWWGFHQWVEKPLVMNGDLVIHTHECKLCGVKEGRVEKL